jgi:hypothetical protein
MIKEKFNIVNLIIKEKIEGLSQKEQILLEKWKSKSDNLITYNKITDQQNIDNRFDLYNKINQQQSWNELQNRIQPKAIKKWIHGIGRWAAILILPLICAYFIYYYYNTNKFQQFIDRNVDYEAKAVLILEDGQTINLEKIKEAELKISNQVQAKNVDNQLTYSVNKEKRLTPQAKEIIHMVKTSGNINGEYNIILSDGTKVWLNSKTELRYPIQFIGTKRKVYLKGEAQFEVSKNADKPFIVITENMNIEVLGTLFNVKTYEATNNITQATLVEGSVKINTENTEVVLSPGQQAHLVEGHDLEVREVNTTLFTSWIKGLYTFNNVELVDITDLLYRWYNVDIFFEREKSKHIRFTGAMNKNNPIDELIALIEKTSSVRFSIVENALIIKE